MKSSLALYAKLLGLFAILMVVVGFNVAVWGLHRQPTRAVLYIPEGNPERGRALIRRHGCGGCHIVPGVGIATGNVGPRLDRMNDRIYVGGVLPNTPTNLIQWIAHPKRVDPRTAMPDLNVREADARDIAAYLYEL
jgi:cytochrome c2